MKAAPTRTIYKCIDFDFCVLSSLRPGLFVLSCILLDGDRERQFPVCRGACPTLLYLALSKVMNNVSLMSTFYGALGQVKV